MEDMTLTCGICDESFDSEEELRHHQLTIHAAAVSTRRRSHENEPDDADEQETAA
jgi:transcription elongation factor Elf1